MYSCLFNIVCIEGKNPMAFVTKEAAFFHDYSHGKPGIYSNLIKNPFKLQNKIKKYQNLTSLILAFEEEA
jgi:hypothetical protein